jgi:predicted ATP-grasp superfamily ATP-dependent carboligase
VAARRGTAADPCRPLLAPLERLGDQLAARFQPRGAIGVDCIATDDGRLCVLEVNPRPTASMELHERLGIGSIAGLHVAACGVASGSRGAAAHQDTVSCSPDRATAWAKAILFAAVPTPITEDLLEGIMARRAAWAATDGGWPAISDLPRPGQTIPGRAPVLTVFAPGDTADAAEAMVRSRVAAVAALLPDSPRQPAIRCGSDALAAGAAKCIR